MWAELCPERKRGVFLQCKIFKGLNMLFFWVYVPRQGHVFKSVTDTENMRQLLQTMGVEFMADHPLAG